MMPMLGISPGRRPSTSHCSKRHEGHVQRGDERRLAAEDGLQAHGLQAVAEHDRHADEGAGLESNKVRSRRVRQEKRATMIAAAAKRRPTKNIGPLTVIGVLHQQEGAAPDHGDQHQHAFGLAEPQETGGSLGVFGDVMILRTT